MKNRNRKFFDKMKLLDKKSDEYIENSEELAR